MSSITAVPFTHMSARPSKPRAYVVPVVRPLPRRPGGIGSDDTW
jgi:hypothetical protein